MKSISPKIPKNRFFSGETSALCFRTFFWHILARSKKNPRNGFSAKSQKLAKMAKNVFFRTNERFSRKRAKISKKRSCYVTYIFTPNFMPSFGKILGTVSEITRDGHMDTYTDNTDFIGPSWFLPGEQ